MSPERKLRVCCGASRFYTEWLVLNGTRPSDPPQTRFGSIPACVTCHKFVGDPRLEYAVGNKHLLEIQKLYTSTSWEMMKETVRKKGPGAPLIFERGRILVPIGYKGELRYQDELPVVAPHPAEPEAAPEDPNEVPF